MIDEPKSKILYKLAPLIREKNIGHDVVVIAKAKVPIIKFKTIFGNINVDISINQTNGIVALKKVQQLLNDIKFLSQDLRSSSAPTHHRHNPERARHRSSDDRHRSRIDPHPRHPPSSSFDPQHQAQLDDHERSVAHVIQELGAAKCLILVIKSVLKQRGMNEVYTGGLGSYSIICLVVSFLQLHPKIQSGDIDPNKNLGVLLLEFFELYGKNFNFDQTGISVRKGGHYFSKSHRGWQRERQPYLLSIEDPADESNDIAGGSHNILSVRSVFAGAFDLLSATLYHRHSLQSSRDEVYGSSTRPLLSVPVPKQQQTTDGDDQPESAAVTKDPMTESLLGEIMGVTKELVDHRRKNLRLFRSGTLQRLLHLSPPPSPGSSLKKKSIVYDPEDRPDRIQSLSVPTETSTRHDRDRSPSPRRSTRPAHTQNGRERLDEDYGRSRRKGRQSDETNGRNSRNTGGSSRPSSGRQLLRYDDDDDTDSQPPSRCKNVGKRKAEDPPPLWVEDVEPSEVADLKPGLRENPSIDSQKLLKRGGPDATDRSLIPPTRSQHEDVQGDPSNRSPAHPDQVKHGVESNPLLLSPDPQTHPKRRKTRQNDSGHHPPRIAHHSLGSGLSPAYDIDHDHSDKLRDMSSRLRGKHRSPRGETQADVETNDSKYHTIGSTSFRRAPSRRSSKFSSGRLIDQMTLNVASDDDQDSSSRSSSSSRSLNHRAPHPLPQQPQPDHEIYFVEDQGSSDSELAIHNLEPAHPYPHQKPPPPRKKSPKAHPKQPRVDELEEGEIVSSSDLSDDDEDDHHHPPIRSLFSLGAHNGSSLPQSARHSNHGRVNTRSVKLSTSTSNSLAVTHEGRSRSLGEADGTTNLTIPPEVDRRRRDSTPIDQVEEGVKAGSDEVEVVVDDEPSIEIVGNFEGSDHRPVPPARARSSFESRQSLWLSKAHPHSTPDHPPYDQL